VAQTTIAPIERPRAVELRISALWTGVALCLAGAAAFLFSRLTAWAPHEDETLALFVGRRGFSDLLEVVHGERGGAPLHFLVASVVAHSGGGVTALRAASALFALASLPLIALLSCRLADRAVAIVATALAAGSWMFLFHGIYGRMYSLFLFTSVLSFLALLRALERGGAGRWGLWGLAVLAAVATHPYGVLVLASQAVYVLLARVRVREAILAFAAVGVLGTPFWLSDLVLAGRFEVGVGGGGEKLGGPWPVLRYLFHVAGDFTVGWWPLTVGAIAIATGGFVLLRRRRRESALLVAAVIVTPTLAFLLARLGSAASPESRHLIFILPFFSTLVAVPLVEASRRWPSLRIALPTLGVAGLLACEVGWAYSKTPQIFEPEPTVRAAARVEAASWLARTSHPDDIFFGYEPIYLGAWERDHAVARIVIPRADPKLAAGRLEELDRPLGRGVWVFDASDTNNCPCARSLAIERLVPRFEGPYEARVFGPFLVIRSSTPTRTMRAYLAQAAQVMIVGKSLFVGDADVNFVTVRQAAARLGYH
jgi:hypothetical protein